MFCNNLVNVLVHLLEHLSFRFRCPSFLLSKFASQLKLIQSVVWVQILVICVTSSILRILLAQFQVSASQVQSTRDPVPGSWWPGCHVPESQFQGSGCQCLVSQGPRVPGYRVSGSRVTGPGSQGPRVPGLMSLFQTMLFFQLSFSSNLKATLKSMHNIINSFGISYVNKTPLRRIRYLGLLK